MNIYCIMCIKYTSDTWHWSDIRKVNDHGMWFTQRQPQLCSSYNKIQGLGKTVRVTKSFPSSSCGWKRHLDEHFNYTAATEGKSVFSSSRASELICIQMCLEKLCKTKINSFSNWVLRCFTGTSATLWNLIFALIAVTFPSKHTRNRWEKDTIGSD